VAQRKTRKRLNLDAVVDEAALLCDEIGAEFLSLSALADRLGVRPPSLYNHIESLGDLYSQLSIKGLNALTDVVEEALAAESKQSPTEAIAVATRQFAKERPTLFQYATYRMHLGEDDRKRYGTRLLEITRDAYQKQTGASQPDEAAEYLLRCLIYGFIALENNGALQPAKDIDGLFNSIIEIADAGIRAVAEK
jgi:AcrR family transcriptional regulator